MRFALKRGSLPRLTTALLGALALVAVANEVDAQEGDLKIGFTAALSGDFAAFGENMQRGMELAIEEINAKGGVDGMKLSATAADDRGEAKEGVLIAQRFCSDASIDVVMGYSFSSIALAAVPIFDDCGLSVLASAVTSPDLSGSSKYFRRNVLTDAIQGAMAGRYATDLLAAKRIALIHQQDDYGIGVTDAFETAAKEGGADIVGREAYVLGTKDFKTQVTTIKAQAPDLLWIGGFYTEAAKIARQARQLGLNVPMIGTDGSLNPELINLGGDSVDGMILYGMFDPTVDKPEVAEFVQRYETKFGSPPNAWAALAYDATYTVAEAARIAKGEGGTVARDGLNEAFGKIDGLPGVTGPTTFDGQGNRKGALLFLEVKGGKFVLAGKQPS